MKFGFFSKKKIKKYQLPHNSAFDAIPDLPTDIQELMLQAVEVRKMRMLRTLNLELGCYPLDNGEIVLGRTKKTQLILQDS
jgi:hypothetical protein